MRIIVCVCVYNRIENIQRWINCWSQSEKHNAELIIIHNFYGNNAELAKFNKLCADNKIKYIPRKGHGFDIGAFQDVCNERLPGFDNNWNAMLWCCDDTIPMSKDFLSPFIKALKVKGTAVACMQISPEVKTHIRTTGFLIRKEVCALLQFPADPVITKEHCYQFEHRSKNIFYEQVINMGFKVVQVAPDETSPLWDTGYTKRLLRQKEHDNLFYPQAKIVFVCPVFDAFPQIISSLICQTHSNWELLLIHDGTNDLSKLIKGYADKRINYIKRERLAKWGHPHRKWALEEIKAGRLGNDAEYICITNADNYYTPVFCEHMVKGFTNGQVAAYCSEMVHSYKAWNIIQCRLERGYVDCGNVIVKKDVAVDIGWRDIDSHSSDWVYFDDIIKKYGANKWAKVRGCLFCHN